MARLEAYAVAEAMVAAIAAAWTKRAPPSMAHPEKGVDALQFDNAYDLAYAISMEQHCCAGRRSNRLRSRWAPFMVRDHRAQPDPDRRSAGADRRPSSRWGRRRSGVRAGARAATAIQRPCAFDPCAMSARPKNGGSHRGSIRRPPSARNLPTGRQPHRPYPCR
jgi:hypothetical protein